MNKTLRKRFVYIDTSVLKDEQGEALLAHLAEEMISVYLYVHDIWEVEEVKQLSNYGYVCETVYGNRMEEAVKASLKKYRQYPHEVCLISVGTALSADYGMDVCSIDRDGIASLCDIAIVKGAMHGKLWWGANAIVLTCILYFILYFYFLDDLPAVMTDGMLAFLLCLIPILLLLCTIVIAVVKRVYTCDDIMDFLDIFIPFP